MWAVVSRPALAQRFPGNATFTSDSFDYIDARTSFFTYAYSASPGMAANMDNVGAKYPAAFADADGDHLQGSKDYKLHIPKDVPVALFWSVTVYDPVNASGLDNGQPFPSINAMDKLEQNADGSTDIYFGPKSPGGRQELARDNPRQGVLRDLPPLWPQAGVLRPDLETK